LTALSLIDYNEYRNDTEVRSVGYLNHDLNVDIKWFKEGAYRRKFNEVHSLTLMIEGTPSSLPFKPKWSAGFIQRSLFFW